MILVSPCDEHFLLEKWYTNKLGYVFQNIKTEVPPRARYLHRVIANAEVGECVDHINGNPSDNRRENLRICSHAENMRNRKVSKSNKLGVKGVYQNGSRYVSSIKFQGVKHYLGSFASVDEAKNAYVSASQKLHKDFSRIQ